MAARRVASLAATLAATLLVVASVAGCQSAYFGAMEKLGIHKRDILVSRVEAAADSQQEAKQEFQDALTQFSSVVEVPPSKLESTYDDLSGAYDDAKAKADEVSERIDSVESVSEALFDEWRGEIDEITNSSLRTSSRRQLERSKVRYQELMAAMRRAEKSMQPVLDTFHDYVLYLKHNLNAQAIASLHGELEGVQANVSALIRDMEASISQARSFIKGMK